MIPFSIVCTTCQARLKVHNEAALGQILQCPKCGSMVAVPEQEGQPAEPATGSSELATDHQTELHPTLTSDSRAETVDHYDSSEINDSLDDQQEPPHSTDPSGQSAQGAWKSLDSPSSATSETETSEPLLPNADWTSPGSQQLRHRILLGTLIAISTMALAGIILLIFSKPDNQQPNTQATNKPSDNQQDSRPDSINKQEAEADSSKQETPETDKPAVENIPPDDNPKVEDKPPEDKNEVPPNSPDTPPGLTAEPVPDTDEEAELSELLQEFSPLLTNTPFDTPAATGPKSSDTVAKKKLPRPTLPRLNIAASLDFAISEFHLTDSVSLHSFLGHVISISALPLELDFDAMASKQVPLELPVALSKKQTTVRQLLSAVLSPHGLGYIESDQYVTISYAPTESPTLTEVAFEVGDLISADPEDQQNPPLLAWIRTLIAPGTWDQAEPTYQLTLKEKHLLVRHQPVVQFQVLRFLTRLRMARQLPLPKNRMNSDISLVPRSQQAQTILNESVSLNFTRSIRLCDLFSNLEKKLGVNFVLNGRTLRQAGWSTRSEVTLVTENETLQQSLNILLTPMDLTTRVVNRNTLEITSLVDEVGRREVEFYAVKHLLHKNRSPEQLIQLLQQKLGSGRLNEEKTSQPILFDPTSKYLMIRESPAIHAKLTYLLSSG